jgi:hypothetical protein
MTFGCSKWQASSLMRGLANPVDINDNEGITESPNLPVPVSVKLDAEIQRKAQIKSGEGRVKEHGRVRKPEGHGRRFERNETLIKCNLALLADTGLQGLAACRMYASVDLHKGVSYTLFWISLNNQCAHATTGNMLGAWGHRSTSRSFTIPLAIGRISSCVWRESMPCRLFLRGMHQVQD